MASEKKAIESEILLDSSLRYLYDTLRVHGGHVVGIKFTHRGTSYVADTPQEAVRLQEILENADEKKARRDRFFARKLQQERDRWNDARFWQLMSGIGKMQTHFLAALLLTDKLGTALSAEQIANALNLESQESLAGMLSGLSKQLKALGLRPGNLYLVETFWQKGKKERWFLPALGFQAIADDLCWPTVYVDSEELERLESKLRDNSKD